MLLNHHVKQLICVNTAHSQMNKLQKNGFPVNGEGRSNTDHMIDNTRGTCKLSQSVKLHFEWTEQKES